VSSIPTWPLVAPASEKPVEPGPVPRFSVIIPAYEAADVIGEAIESALRQTPTPHEVVVCDDGSTDDVAAAVAEFGGRVVLLRQPHRGIAAARNAAVAATSGDFVVMLDADDIYESDRLAALGQLAAARPDLDILATDLWYEREGVTERRFYEGVEFPVDHQRLAILEACFVACPALRRSRLLELAGFDESLEVGEDWDLLVRMILAGSKAGLVDQPLFRYRLRPGSATADRVRTLGSRVAVLEKTRQHPALTADERSFLERCLVRARARAVLTDAKVAAASRTPRFRRSLLGLAVSTNIPPTTRMVLGAAAFAPVAATSLLDWEERRVAKAMPLRSHPGS
jgi:glycosyltransferase involved in cell wall biosynthesis